MKEQITQVIQKLFALIEQQKEINERDVIYLCKLAAAGKLSGFHIGNVQAVGRNFQGKSIYPKTLGQRYMCRVCSKTISFLQAVWQEREKLI